MDVLRGSGRTTLQISSSSSAGSTRTSTHGCRLVCHAVVRPLQGPCVVRLTHNSRVSGAVPPHAQTVSSNCTLQQYMAQVIDLFAGMQLPLGGKMAKVGDGRLQLTVPRIQLMDVWVQPCVVAAVATFPDRIEATSCTEDCELVGSHHVTDLRLNERYNLDVCLTFTWDDGAAGRAGAGRQQGRRRPGVIHADTRFEVEIDIPPPFSMLPVSVLTATGNAAFGAVLPVITKACVSKMGQEYVVWVNKKAEFGPT